MKLITYQTFSVLDDAMLVAATLHQNGILTEVSKKSPKLDSVFIGTDYVDEYDLKIPADKFGEANAILLKNAQEGEVSADHPLHSMDNEELKAIVAAPDEWGADNYIVATQLLKKKGRVTNPNYYQRIT
jgi:hypothetical protein